MLEEMHLEHIPEDPAAATLEAVKDRREMFNVPAAVPLEGYPYEKIYKKNCENVIGYLPVPVGIVGPIRIDDASHHVPFATTEGALISSINRGAKALTVSGGVETMIERVGISRAPILECKDLSTVREVLAWLAENEQTVREIFGKTTNHGKLIKYESHVVGTKIHLRLSVNSKDAMGMNMITIGSENITNHIANALFPERVEVATLSGNMCTDKKASAVNWILGRGFRGNAVATVKRDVLRKLLHCDVDDFVTLNHEKNFVGSSMANTVGGNNSHAANIVAAFYLATGQDIAQVGTSAMCLFNASKDKNGDLKLECMMPSMELATVGGGTSLSAQRGCLSITGAESSADLAKVVISSVMAGELSLLAAQCAGHLASAHANLGRAGPAQAHNATAASEGGAASSSSSDGGGAAAAAEMKMKADAMGASNKRRIHTAAAEANADANADADLSFNTPTLPVP